MSAQRAPMAPGGTPEGVLRKYWGFNAFRSCQQVRGFGFQLCTLPDRRLTIPMHPTHRAWRCGGGASGPDNLVRRCRRSRSRCCLTMPFHPIHPQDVVEAVLAGADNLVVMVRQKHVFLLPPLPPPCRQPAV